MKNARLFNRDHIIVNGTIIHIETMNYSHKDWMCRNGLEATETVKTETGEKFVIWANWARQLACAIPA